MGNCRYEDGKFLKKKNTFTDFISCAEFLIAKKYTCNEKLCIEGRSAGGLTMGAMTSILPFLLRPSSPASLTILWSPDFAVLLSFAQYGCNSVTADAGAVLNMRPDLFRAAIMGVPFVDVLTTMQDESIPLTVRPFAVIHSLLLPG